jgi:hypothetical protein
LLELAVIKLRLMRGCPEGGIPKPVVLSDTPNTMDKKPGGSGEPDPIEAQRARGAAKHAVTAGNDRSAR